MWIFIVLAEHPSFVGAETLTWPDPDFLVRRNRHIFFLTRARACARTCGGPVLVCD